MYSADADGLKQLNDWLTDWLTDWLIDWLIDWLTVGEAEVVDSRR